MSTYSDIDKIVSADDLTISCANNKTILLDKVVYDDLRVVPGSFDRPGVGGATPDPTIVAYDVNAGGVITYLLCNIRRTDTGADDDWVGTSSGQLPMLLEIDFHYQIDTIGSRQQGTK